jgi:hypothetical protein
MITGLLLLLMCAAIAFAWLFAGVIFVGAIATEIGSLISQARN